MGNGEFMRSDKLEELLKTPNHQLTGKQATFKMAGLINMYHSVDQFFESTDEKMKQKTLFVKKC